MKPNTYGKYSQSVAYSSIKKVAPSTTSPATNKKTYNRTSAQFDVINQFNKALDSEKIALSSDVRKMIENQLKLQPNAMREGKMNIYSLVNAYKELNRLNLLNPNDHSNFVIFPYCIDTSKDEKDREYVAQIILKPRAFISAMGNMISVEINNNQTSIGKDRDGNPLYDIDSIKVKADFKKTDGKPVHFEETYSTSELFRYNISKFSDGYKETLDLPENKIMKNTIEPLMSKASITPNEMVEYSRIPEKYSPNDISMMKAYRPILLETTALSTFIKNKDDKNNGKIQGIKFVETVKEYIDNTCSTRSVNGITRLDELLAIHQSTITRDCNSNLPLMSRIMYPNNRNKFKKDGKPSMDNTYRKPINFTSRLSVSLFDDKGKVLPHRINKYKNKQSDLVLERH